MFIVSYPYNIGYVPISGGALAPALEVELISGTRSTKAVGVVDSGSTITIFNPEHAALIGIEEVTTGERGQVGTQGGPVFYYVFEIEMRIQMDNNRFPCRIGFFDTRRPRNILGRDYVFRHYQIGFRDFTQTLNLVREDFHSSLTITSGLL